MKRAGEKSSNKFALLFASIVAIVVIVAGFLFFNPFGGKHLTQLRKQLLLVAVLLPKL